MKVTKVFICVSVVAAFYGLVGCALQPYAQDQKDTCKSTQVLYTDLLKAPEERSYILVNGRDCTEYYNG